MYRLSTHVSCVDTADSSYGHLFCFAFAAECVDVAGFKHHIAGFRHFGTLPSMRAITQQVLYQLCRVCLPSFLGLLKLKSRLGNNNLQSSDDLRGDVVRGLRSRYCRNMYVCMSMYAYICMYVCMYVCIYINVYMQICKYANMIPVQPPPPPPPPNGSPSHPPPCGASPLPVVWCGPEVGLLGVVPPLPPAAWCGFGFSCGGSPLALGIFGCLVYSFLCS